MVLQTLDSMGPQHGYGHRRAGSSRSVMTLLKLNEGTVYAALMRLQHQRWIVASWGASENNRKAKFYAITKAGRRQLVKDLTNWDRISGVMARLLRGAGRFLTCGRHWVTRFSRLGFAWARRRIDSEVRAEFDAHLDLLVERYVRSGMTPAEARAAALRQLGNLTLAREEVYQLNGIGWIDALGQDLRNAFRQLRRGPGVSAVVIATLAVGIGGTTGVFSVLQAVLLAPLPYEQPGQLVRLYQQEPGKPDTRHYFTGAHFSSLRDNAASFEAVTAIANYRETGRDLVRDGRALPLRAYARDERLFQYAASGLIARPGVRAGATTREHAASC